MSLVRFRPEAPTKQSPGRAPPFQATCECSSSGRAPPCQGGGSEFEPRHSLHFLEQLCSIRCHSQVVRQSSAKAPPPVQIWVAPPKKKHLHSRCFFFGYLGFFKLLGRSEFALRRGFAFGKTLERRKSGAAQKGRWARCRKPIENLKYLDCSDLTKQKDIRRVKPHRYTM